MGILSAKIWEGHPCGYFMPWLGHQSLCQQKVPESERHQCCGWVGAHGSFPPYSLIVLCSAFAVGVIANIYGRFFRGNAFAVMVRPLVLLYAGKLNQAGELDHRCTVSTTFGSRKWRPATFCIPTGLWKLCVVLDWLPGRFAANLGVHWTDRRAWYLSCNCIPNPVA